MKYQIGFTNPIFVDATTPEGAVMELRKKVCQLDSYYDPYYEIKEVKCPHIILVEPHTVKSAPRESEEAQKRQPTAAGSPLLSPEPHLGPREPMHGDALVEFVDE